MSSLPSHRSRTGGDAPRASSTVQSVDRALLVLESLARLGSGGATEIAQELGVHKSTVSRLLASLEARGFVEQADAWGKYRLGLTLARLAGQAVAQVDLTRLGQEVCDALASQVGETANLAVLDGPRIVNIVEGRAEAEVVLRTWIGQTSPAHATASGKALLLDHDRRALVARLGRRLEGFTDQTITQIPQLTDDLHSAQDRGWATVVEELEVGLNAVAAPVYDYSGDLVAALSVSGPGYRLAEERFGEVADQVMTAAGEVTQRLGGHVPQAAG